MKRMAAAAGLAVAGWTAALHAQEIPPAAEKIAIGDWELAPVVEARLRAELGRELGSRESAALVERARLGVDVRRDTLEARVVLQDARLLGAGTDIAGGPVALAVTEANEGWIEVRTASARPSYIRLGRQPIVWGEGRLLGKNDWSPTGRTLDAARGRVAVGDATFELMTAILGRGTVPAVAAYGELLGARAEMALDPRLGFEAYILARFAQANPVPSLDGTVRGQTYTGSLRVHGHASAWAWGVEGAYQLGHVDELGEDRAAWAAAGHIACALERVWLRPNVRFGVAYASGDSGASTYRAFDPLLPDVHAWHGAMSLFAWSNEEEASVRVAVVPFADAELLAEYRYVRLAESGSVWRTGDLTRIGAAPGNTQADLAHEVDLLLTWSTELPVALSVGYSLLALGGGGRAIVSDNQLGSPDLSHFAFAQASLIIP